MAGALIQSRVLNACAVEAASFTKRHRAGGAPSPTTIPLLRFRRADRIAACRSLACLRGLTGYQSLCNLSRRHRGRSPSHTSDSKSPFKNFQIKPPRVR
jgi:hypothetical protein